ncbi:hypothetical protein GEMRC1_009286 [Eukaryota sp. GEM-RC1]
MSTLVANRLTSIEIMSSLVPVLCGVDESINSDCDYEFFFSILCHVIPVIFERVADVSPYVRIKAIAFLSDLLVSINSNQSNSRLSSLKSSFFTPDLIDSLLLRLHDQKPIVRKSVVSLIPHLYSFAPSAVCSALRTMSFDQSSLVRKQVVIEICNRLNTAGDGALIDEFSRIYVNNLLGLIGDPETSIKNQLSNSFLNLIIEPMTNQNYSYSLVSVLSLIRSNHFDLIRAIFEFLLSMKQKHHVDPRIFLNYPDNLNFDISTGSTVLLVSSSLFFPFRYEFDFLKEIIERFPSITHHVFDYLKKSPSTLPKSKELVPFLKQILKNSPSTAHSHCIIKGLAYSNEKSTEVFLNQLLEQLTVHFIETIESRFSESSDPDCRVDVHFLSNQLFIIGELSIFIPFSKQLLSSLTSTIHGLLTPSCPLNSTKLNAFAVITLGKLMTISESIAKKSITLMCALLGTITNSIDPIPISDSVVRVNILVVLTNICQRFPSIVDSRLPIITKCLSDPCHDVSKAALSLIAVGLKEDYLKLRPPLYFRVLFACSVESLGGIARAVVQTTVCNRPQRKGMLVACFEESLFVLSGNRAHPTFNQFPQSNDELMAFDLSGVGNAARRRVVYSVVLQACSDVDKFNIANKVVDLLSIIVDGDLKVIDCYDVISDCFAILASREVRLASINDLQPSESKNEEDLINDESKIEQASKKLLSSLERRNLAERIVPTLAGLRLVLGREQSPLLGELFSCVHILLDEFKNDLEMVLAADPDFAAEVMAERSTELESAHVTPGRRSLRAPSSNVTPAVLSTAMSRVAASSIAASSIKRRIDNSVRATPLREVNGTPAPLETPRLRTNVKSRLAIDSDDDLVDLEEELSVSVVTESKTKKKIAKGKTRGRSKTRSSKPKKGKK